MNRKESVKLIIEQEGCTLIKIEENEDMRKIAVHYQDEEGYKYRKGIYNQNFANGIRKHQYDIKNPYCFANIDLTLQKDNPYGTKIIPESYIGSTKKSKFICGKCGKEFEDLLWNVFNYEHKVCPDCIHSTQRTKLADYDVLKEEIESYGYTWLDKEWKGNHDFVNVMDKDGYKCKTKLEYLRAGSEIEKFSSTSNYLIENLKLYCKNNGLDFESIYKKNEEGKYSRNYFRHNKSPEDFVAKKLYNTRFGSNNGPKGRSSLQSKVKEYLEKNDIEFIEEYIFKDCIFKTDKIPLKFDFYLPKKNTVIEVQGRQHYEPIKYFGGEPIFLNQVARDEAKRKYCKDNNIQLLEMPYWKFNKNNSYKTILSNLL